MTPQAPKAADLRVEAGIEFLKNPSQTVSGFTFIVDNRPAISRRAQREGKK